MLFTHFELGCLTSYNILLQGMLYLIKFFQVWVYDYAKDDGPGEGWILCSFYHEPLCTWIKTNLYKFAISSLTAFKLAKQALKSYLKITCEFQARSPLNKKLVPQRIMVKTTWSSDRSWSAIFSVILYYFILPSSLLLCSNVKKSEMASQISFKRKLCGIKWGHFYNKTVNK